MLQAFKKQRAKRLSVAVLALLILVPCANASLATASYKVSLLALEFNSTDYTEHNFPSNANYTLPWRVELTNKLVYNETTESPSGKVLFQNMLNISEGILEIQWFETTDDKGLMDVYASETSSGNLIDTITYSIDELWTLKMSVDGFTYANASGVQIEFNFNGFGISNVSACGGIADSAESGFVQLEFSSGTEYGIDIVYAMMPLLLTLAVIGMVVKMVDRMGKYGS